MKVILRRDQRSGLLGKPTFMLDIRAELSDGESRAISTYRLGKTLLYSKAEITDPGKGLLGLASRLAFHAMNISVTIDDLTSGKRIECKDIVEMLAVEQQLKDAATTFKAILDAATHFGGEEVLVV